MSHRVRAVAVVSSFEVEAFIVNIYGGGAFADAVQAARLVWLSGDYAGDDPLAEIGDLAAIETEIAERAKVKARSAIASALTDAAREVIAEAVADGRAVAVDRPT